MPPGRGSKRPNAAGGVGSDSHHSSRSHPPNRSRLHDVQAEDRTPLLGNVLQQPPHHQSNSSGISGSSGAASSTAPSLPPPRQLGQRQRSVGEVFTLDDDARVIHKPPQPTHLGRNFSIFVLNDAAENDTALTSGGSRHDGAVGGESNTQGRRRGMHRRMWSASTEPTRNVERKGADAGGVTFRRVPPKDGAIPEVRSSSHFGPPSQPSEVGMDPRTKPEEVFTKSHDKSTKRRREKVVASSSMGIDSRRSGSGKRGANETKGSGRRFRILWQHAPVGKIVVILLYSALLAYTAMVILGPLILLPIDKAEWCPDYALIEEDEFAAGRSASDDEDDGGQVWGGSEYENPDYITDPCRYRRLPQLMGLTLEECDLSRRMLASVLLGGAIGYERRASDRPAGIRTMGLVSLGSCFFTISSQLAFKSSTMGWDASRVTAAIPSGVGFLGAGLIWKGTVGAGVDEVHQVHGLTTAASLWLSAAVGVGAGGALYFVSAYSVVLVMMILRYGPKLYFQDDASYNEEDDYDDSDSSLDSNMSENDLGSDKGGLGLDKPQELKLSRQYSALSGVGDGLPSLFHPSWQKHVHETNMDRKVTSANGGGEEEMTQGDSCPSFVSYSTPYSKGDIGGEEERQKLQCETTAGYGSLCLPDEDKERDPLTWSFRSLDDDDRDSKKKVMFEDLLPAVDRSNATAQYSSRRSSSKLSSSKHSNGAEKKHKHKKMPHIRPSFHS